MQLHPENMRKLDKSSFLAMAEDIENLYGGFLQNFIAESSTCLRQRYGLKKF